MKPRRSNRSPIRLVIAALAVSFPPLTGCLPTTSLPTQSEILDRKDPVTERRYLLYVPSVYTDRHDWPLVVVCHGTNPYDTAPFQMQEWAQFCEDKGIIVVTPFLIGTQGDFPPPPDIQIPRQREDETAILSIVKSLKQSYRIAEEKVFMTGWSAGSFAILHTGMGHPDIFRALAIRQGNFDERFMVVPEWKLDRWQPMMLILGRNDVIRDQTKACLDYLRGQGQFVETEEIPGPHRRIDPLPIWKFFDRIMRERPWIRISADPAPENPLDVQFSLKATPAAKRVVWFFGDNERSREESPRHAYPAPGRYTVTANVELVGGQKYARKRTFQIGKR